MIANDLQHLFNGTHCLSKRQLRDYAAGAISREEAYAVESHLNTCPLCSAAADGMLAHFPESAEVLAEVDAGFLKEHFKKHSPQIHLNTVAPAAAASPVTRRIPGGRTIELTSLRTMGIAAGVLLLIASLWWMQNGAHKTETSLGEGSPIAQADAPDASPAGGAPETERRLARASAVIQPQQSSREAAEADKKIAASQGVMKDEAATMAESENYSAPVSSPLRQATAAAPVEKAKAVPAGKADDAVTEQKMDDVAVRSRRYARPLIEPAQPAARSTITDKEIEKMPTRNPLDAASTAPGVYQGRSGGGPNIGGGRSENTTYVVDGVVKAPVDGKALYKKGSYIEALKVFRSQISKSGGAEREEAMLYAARCHRALGQSTSAKKLLQELAAGTGTRARAARRELRSMGVATSDEATDKSSR